MSRTVHFMSLVDDRSPCGYRDPRLTHTQDPFLSYGWRWVGCQTCLSARRLHPDTL